MSTANADRALKFVEWLKKLRFCMPEMTLKKAYELYEKKLEEEEIIHEPK